MPAASVATAKKRRRNRFLSPSAVHSSHAIHYFFFLQDDFSGTRISLTLQTFSIGIDAEEKIRGYEPFRKRSTQRDRYVGGRSATGLYLSRDLSRNSSA